MAEAGAHIVGTNCKFDPFISLETMRRMKAGLDSKGLHPHLICQPLGFRTPDANNFGVFYLPEFPFGRVFDFISGIDVRFVIMALKLAAMEPRQITWIEAASFAREAFNLGIRVIGGKNSIHA